LPILLMLLMFPGCGIGVQPLMPTPVVYSESGFEPLAHIPEDERWIPRRVFYATNRARTDDPQKIEYGNNVSDTVSVGMALVGFDGPDVTWSTLDDISTAAQRDVDVSLSIAGIMEKGRYATSDSLEQAASPEAAGFMLDSLRDVIDDARDKDVLTYVHGAKVNFYNACVFAAQLDHFMGRDLTSVAFAWPTHQDIFSYIGGPDLARSYDSGAVLATFIELLAEETNAEQIHVLSWSAGARVAVSALADLASRYPDATPEELHERFRLGTVYFAAGDVPTAEFLRHAEAMNSLVDQLIVTQTDDDAALKASERVMAGGRRIGEESPRLFEQERDLLARLDKFEVVDVSIGSDARGFDITGHRYWFTHPWASSDVLLSIRTRLHPIERGLAQGPEPYLYYIPSDYPQRLRTLLQSSDLGAWDDVSE